MHLRHQSRRFRKLDLQGFSARAIHSCPTVVRLIFKTGMTGATRKLDGSRSMQRKKRPRRCVFRDLDVVFKVYGSGRGGFLSHDVTKTFVASPRAHITVMAKP